ncbi:MAG: hypothetical protein ACK4UJ_05240 [Leptonema sp. (in: bacteria)]
MKFKFLFLICIGFYSLYPQSFRNVHGSFTLDDIQKNIDFDIFLERNLYEEAETIPIYFRVRNVGFESFRFYLEQEYRTSFVLEILNQKGENIEPEIKIESTKDFNLYAIQKNKIEDFVGNPVKEVLLHPNEEFIKTYYIKNLPIGHFRIIGYFKPIPFDPRYKKNLIFMSKNQIHINIEKEKSVYKFDDEIELQKEAIPSPEETVYLFLMAEYHKNWDNYLKYIELNEFIYSYELFANEYKNGNPKEKLNVLNRFKYYLINQNLDPIIDFKIQKVEHIDKTHSKVYAEVKRGNLNYKVQYLYEYVLKKKNFWKITGVVVSVLSKKK